MPDPVRCPACKAPLSASRVDFRRGLTACDHCGVVSKLNDFSVDPPSGTTEERRPAKRSADAPVTRPEGWTVEERAGVVAVRWRWWSLMYVPLAFFCVAWDSFLVFWYAMALGGAGGGGFEWIAIVFPIAHVAVGVGLTYFVLCGFLNRTVVTAGHGTVRVKHEPLPWRGSKTHDADGFTRLFMRDSASGGSRSNQNGQPTYDLLARTADGGEVTLLHGLDARNKVRFLARTVGDALDVPAE